MIGILPDIEEDKKPKTLHHLKSIFLVKKKKKNQRKYFFYYLFIIFFFTSSPDLSISSLNSFTGLIVNWSKRPSIFFFFFFFLLKEFTFAHLTHTHTHTHTKCPPRALSLSHSQQHTITRGHKIKLYALTTKINNKH